MLNKILNRSASESNKLLPVVKQIMEESAWGIKAWVGEAKNSPYEGGFGVSGYGSIIYPTNEQNLTLPLEIIKPKTPPYQIGDFVIAYNDFGHGYIKVGTPQNSNMVTGNGKKLSIIDNIDNPSLVIECYDGNYSSAMEDTGHWYHVYNTETGEHTYNVTGYGGTWKAKIPGWESWSTQRGPVIQNSYVYLFSNIGS